jgi:hypothetical protein
MRARVLPTPDGPTPAEAVREAEAGLRRSGYSALAEIRCEALGDGVRLAGRVPSYYLKQVAQAVASEALGGLAVLNRIEVVAPPARPPVGGTPPAWREHPGRPRPEGADGPPESHPKTQL